MRNFILPLRHLVLQPGLTVPVYLENPTSILAMESAAKEHKEIILCAQRSNNYPNKSADIYEIGTRADIVQVLRLPDSSVHVMVQTTNAVQIENISVDSDGLFTGDASNIEQTDDSKDERVIALRDKLSENLSRIARNKRIDLSKLRMVTNGYPMAAFIDAVIQMADIDTEVAIQVLGMKTYFEKLSLLMEQIAILIEMAKIDDAINRRVNNQMDSGRKEAILHEKIRAIQKELGEDDGGDEMDNVSLKKRIAESKMPDEARKKAETELRRLRQLQPMSPEASVIKTYLDELLAMPWGKSDIVPVDLKLARAELDREHSGMEFVKMRILEHLAVMKKTGNMRGSIICLVGAPGVGKTSLGKSVAAALGRKYHRMALGGLSDEAHLRGHRKTYIGSQPGRIMDALKRAGVNNPVIVLDEIDKLGKDHRGDPESALLEILDPEQNKGFRDHYLECDFDLSNIMFIATANSLNIAPALRDRMEIIEMPGYSEIEKLSIARNHLIARAATDAGWDPSNITISDDAIKHIINKYTAESGVRELRREITAVLRKTLLELDGADVPTEFTIPKIDEILSLRTYAGFNKRIGFGVRA
ncbi:MAG: AAA family ATPase [Alphaproteobacteria bacterium]|nr:AAA family ATPase [Alphaproteobacteria bacterium]